MTSRHLSERLRAHGWRCLAALLLLAITACGPGTGGTGTGPVSGVVSYSAAVAATPAAAPSSCVADCRSTVLRLAPDSVQFAQGCVHFVHDGGWSVDGNDTAVIEGHLESGGASTTGTLRLQFTGAPDDSPQVVITLVDAAGAQVGVPMTLSRDATPIPAQALTCP